MKKLTLLSLGVACALNSANLYAFEDGTINIWMPLDKGQKGMTYVVNKFEEETGIKVKVEYPENLQERYVQMASLGKGPDIMIFAHDRFGGYAESGLVREVNPGQAFKDKFQDFTWDAVSYKGKAYGYPIAAESLSLIYNKDLVKEPIKNWEDVFALDERLSKQGKKAIAWDLKNPYFTHPLYSSAGAYVFGQNEDGFNPQDTNVNGPEAKRTMRFLKQLIDKGVMTQDIDYAYAEAAFAQGNVAMTINGPWGWANIEKVGLNYGVAELPKFEGKASRPFVGILMAGINTASPNPEIAQEFIEQYLLSMESLRFMNSQVPIGVPALKAFSDELQDDPRIKASLVNAQNGDIMPNIPQIMGYWGGLESAITNVVENKQTVDESLVMLEKRLLKK